MVTENNIYENMIFYQKCDFCNHIITEEEMKKLHVFPAEKCGYVKVTCPSCNHRMIRKISNIKENTVMRDFVVLAKANYLSKSGDIKPGLVFIDEEKITFLAPKDDIM
jgi:phage FluMu protein Com